MKKLIYILALPLFIAMQCDKDDNKKPDNTGGDTDTTMVDSLQAEIDKLPPITTSGEGTFACLFNGKAWIANSGGFGKRAFFADYFEGFLTVEGARHAYANGQRDKLREVILVETEDYCSIDNRKYTISTNDCGTGRLVTFYDDCRYKLFNAEYFGELELLRFDSLERIVSVTFSYTYIADSYDSFGDFCSRDTNTVTHGRADIKY